MAEYLRRKKKKPSKAKIIQYAQVDSVEDEYAETELNQVPDDETEDQSAGEGIYLE